MLNIGFNMDLFRFSSIKENGRNQFAINQIKIKLEETNLFSSIDFYEYCMYINYMYNAIYLGEIVKLIVYLIPNFKVEIYNQQNQKINEINLN